MRTLAIILSSLFLSTCFATAQTGPTTLLMPTPSNVQPGTGQLVVDQLFTVAVTGAKDARLDSGVPRFVDQLSRQTGMPLNSEMADPSKATLVIRSENSGRKVQELGENESYTLEVTSSRATLTASTPLGALHGLQTFLQLVEPTPTGFAVPDLTIHDE